VPPMPMVPTADAARTVVSPDHAAARVVIIGIIGVVIRIIVAAADEAAMVVREAEAAVMKPTAMEAAAVEAANMMHAAAMPAAATETAAMETSAVEAAAHVTTTAHVTATTMTPATMSASTMSASTADFGHKTASNGFRRGHRARTDWRHGLGAPAWRGGEQQHRCRRNAEAADKAPP
jgi:hypothetical protein